MIRHVVLFNYAADVTESQVQNIIDELNRLPSLISEIRDWQIAEDQGQRSGSFRFALIAHFEDMAAVERYLNHPEHVRVIEKAGPLLSDLAEHDHEVS